MKRILALLVLLSATPAAAIEDPTRFYEYKMRRELRRQKSLELRREMVLGRGPAVYPIRIPYAPTPRWNFGGPIEYRRSSRGPELFIFDIDPPSISMPQCDGSP